MAVFPSRLFRQTLLLLGCFCLTAAPSLADGPVSNAQEGTGTPWALKMFDVYGVTSHDIGFVARGANVQYSFRFKNIYQETVHISGVRSSCGCSSPKPTQTTIRSNEEAAIVVTVDTERHSHQKNPNITVTFDSPKFAEVVLPLSVYIRTDVVLKPGQINFGVVDQGQPSSQTVKINYAGRSDWTITDIRSKNEHLAANIKEINRQGGRVDYEMVVSLKETAPVGPMRDVVTLVTDDANSPFVPVLVEARVESDITVTPSPLSLGQVTAGGTKTVNVILRGKKSFQIEEIHCDDQEEPLDVTLAAAPRTVHVLPLSVPIPEQPGEFTETISVTIAGRDKPLTFKAYGQAMGN